MAGTAAGALKRRAAAIGLTPEALLAREAAGERWCYRCEAFHPRADFGNDSTRADGRERSCRASRNRSARERYTPHPALRHGPLPNPPRDGDREQARQRVNVLVRTGRLPHPNALACTDCGHEWAEGERRHEYDHYLGYAAEHHLHVEPVCTTCHRRRCDDRGEIEQHRDAAGRYAPREVVACG